MRSALSVAIFFLVACSTQPGLWQWQHRDTGYAEKYRARDIYQCERYSLENGMDDDLHELKMTREYGGWGDFDFEFCMQERGWHLEFVTPGP